jgi:biopolymer transport protein ExbD
MGGATPIPGRGGKKAVDAAINLVPFIDLLSCCLSFLLITAVWTQMASIEAAPSGHGDVAGSAPPSATLAIDADGYTFVGSTGHPSVIPRKGGDYDVVRLAEVLRGAKAESPGLDALSLHPADAVQYDQVIRAMDVAKAARFPTIAVGE